MLSSLDELALEVRFLDRATEFYETHLGLDGARFDRESGHIDRESAYDDHETVYEVGDTSLVLREPSTVPRGGLHVHYAFSTPESAYDDWYDRLDAEFNLVEHEFGSARSLYLDDPDGHCVEIGTGGEQSDDSPTGDPPLTGVFEVVLEVEQLTPAIAFYEELGFDVVDRGDTRKRVRLAGPVDLELWEPHRGIADARGAVHADLAFRTPDPGTAADAIADRACDVSNVESGVRVRDPDGHYLTFRAE